MNTPNIRYYARFERNRNGKGKTPKYTIIKEKGYYPPMEELRGRNGDISMYLMEKLKEGLRVPSYRLQAKGSLNFTGLKDYFVDGKLTGFAYGYPLDTETYGGKNKKPNPFCSYANDGFLFKVYNNESKEVTPDIIEMIVLKDAKPLIGSYCKSLEQGGFNNVLEILRGGKDV